MSQTMELLPRYLEIIRESIARKTRVKHGFWWKCGTRLHHTPGHPVTDRSRLCRAASVTKVAGSKLPLDNLNKILIVPLTTHPSELSMSDVGREILSHLQGRPEFSNVLSFFFSFCYYCWIWDKSLTVHPNLDCLSFLSVWYTDVCCHTWLDILVLVLVSWVDLYLE